MNTVTPESRPMLAPRVRLQTDPASGEPVLLYPEGILVLNETAHEIVSRCNGADTVSMITDALAAEYEADPEELSKDVVDCLQQLAQRNFIIPAS